MKTFGIRLEPELLEKIDARRHGRPRSGWIRDELKKVLSEEPDKN